MFSNTEIEAVFKITVGLAFLVNYIIYSSEIQRLREKHRQCLLFCQEILERVNDLEDAEDEESDDESLPPLISPDMTPSVTPPASPLALRRASMPSSYSPYNFEIDYDFEIPELNEAPVTTHELRYKID